MIDARKTFNKVTQTINDFSDDQLNGLTTIINSYRGKSVNFKKNSWLKKTFNKNKYEDVEGLCKITSIKEISENDFSLNPGRYVGFTIKFDENFDYKKRVYEINEELKKLNDENSKLLKELKEQTYD